MALNKLAGTQLYTFLECVKCNAHVPSFPAVCSLQSGPAGESVCDTPPGRKQGRSVANYWQGKWPFVCLWVSMILIVTL